MRRAWAKGEETQISSKHMNHYWSAFALFWGTYISCLSFIEIFEVFDKEAVQWTDDDHVDGDAVGNLISRVLGIGQVAIITAEELNLNLAPEKRQKGW